ncbi:hypothetical protein NDU88_003425, partial [Pleurodeles waltl]
RTVFSRRRRRIQAGVADGQSRGEDARKKKTQCREADQTSRRTGESCRRQDRVSGPATLWEESGPV